MNTKNPAVIKQLDLKSPIAVHKGKKKNKGNLPYLRFRKRLRRDMF